MPQKKNPDALELIRGKSGRLTGNAVRLLVVLKGLPLAYDKDLQEDKEAAFDTFDTLRDILALAAQNAREMKVDAKACADAVAGHPGILATDLADHLVVHGIPFRQAHAAVGRVVAQAESRGVRLDELGMADLETIDPSFAGLPPADLQARASLLRRAGPGGPAPQAVRRDAQALISEIATRAAQIKTDHAPCPLMRELLDAGRWPAGQS